MMLIAYECDQIRGWSYMSVVTYAGVQKIKYSDMRVARYDGVHI